MARPPLIRSTLASLTRAAQFSLLTTHCPRMWDPSSRPHNQSTEKANHFDYEFRTSCRARQSQSNHGLGTVALFNSFSFVAWKTVKIRKVQLSTYFPQFARRFFSGSNLRSPFLRMNCAPEFKQSTSRAQRVTMQKFYLNVHHMCMGSGQVCWPSVFSFSLSLLLIWYVVECADFVRTLCMHRMW